VLWILPRVALAAAAVAGIAGASDGIPARIVQADAALIPDPQTAELAAFGFESAVSDLYWMRAVQIVGSDRGAHGQSAAIGALIDVVTTLDPWVDHPYRFAAIWMQDDERSLRKANELIRRGIDHHPDDWRNYFYLAFNHFFFLGEPEEAARALRPAISLEGAPAYLTRLVARLESHSGGLDASAAFLREMALQAKSDEERVPYVTALREIQTERVARYLDAARAEFVRRHARDIASVDELVTGGVLSELPRDPSYGGWTISPLTGQIVSKSLRFRYEVKIDATSRRQLARFRERSKQTQDE
jgi:hypothetical protein